MDLTKLKKAKNIKTSEVKLFDGEVARLNFLKENLEWVGIGR